MSSYAIIYHSGTKGQKWGKRQYQNEDGSLTPLGRLHYGIGPARKKITKEAKDTLTIKGQRWGTDDDEKWFRSNKKSSKSKTTSEESSTKKKSVSEMTNKELDEYITRLQKEKQVKELTEAINKTSVNSSENTKKANKGKSWVADVASKAATGAATTVLSATLVYVAGGVVNKMAGDTVVKGGKGYPDKDKKKD
jgi:hypothetical protein